MVLRSRKSSPHKVANIVRHRIETGGERVWRLTDFGDLPVTPVARALSRLAREGFIQRLSKGTYFRPRQTSFGKSLPNPAAVRRRADEKATLFPSGVGAANLLGFTTQNPVRGELATTGFSLPRKLIGDGAIVHTRRPAAWARLSEREAAMLDFLRRAGRTSELSPSQTVARALALMQEEGMYERLARVAGTEPPRVRALLGAMGEQLGKDAKTLEKLRRSLNAFSRFDFGNLAALPNAREWQAKERPKR